MSRNSAGHLTQLGRLGSGGDEERLPRLVATDLDGTLVRSDSTVSAYTQQVLAQLDEGGVPVVFVTGRPLRWAEDVFDHVGRHGLAVISNGALVWDVAKREAVLTRTIDPVVGVEVCELIRAAVPGSAFAVETLAGISLEPDFRERHPVPEGSRRGAIAELLRSASLRSRSWPVTRSSATRSSGTAPRRRSETVP